MYLESLVAIGIDLKEHDINLKKITGSGRWWRVGRRWQVMLDGLEITQFTYFQQCGGWIWIRSRERLRMGWNGSRVSAGCGFDLRHCVGGRAGYGRKVTYGEMRLAEEEQFSAYSFDYADVASLWKHLELYEVECLGLLEKAKGFDGMMS